MNLLEQLFKDRFKNKTSLQGIDKEDLWSNITTDLDATVEAGNNSRSNKWPLFALLLLIFGGLAYFFFDGLKKEQTTGDKSSKEIATSTIDSKIFDEKNTPLIHIENNNSTNEESIAENNITKTTTATNTSDVNKKLEKTIDANEIVKRTAIPDVDNQTTIESKSSSVQNISDSNSGLFDVKPTIENNSSVVSAKEPTDNNIEKFDTENSLNIAPENQLKNASVTEAENKIAFTSLMLTAKQSPLFDFDESIGNPVIPKTIKKSPFEISLQMGLNSLLVNHKKGNDNADLVDDLSQSISSSLGYSAGVQIAYLFNKKYTISTGLHYNYFQTIFDRTRDFSTTIIDDNAKERNAIATRVVLHHNDFKLMSIPLEIGVRKQFANFDFGVNLGLSYNFFLSQQGKSIDDEQSFAEFDAASSTALPYRKSFVAYQLNTYIDAKLNRQIKIRLSPVFKYAPIGKSDLHGVDQDVMIIGLNGGVVYRF